MAGFNFTQVGGDNLAGFNHGGFAGGARITYPINTAWSVGGELLYSHRGSELDTETEIGKDRAWDELSVNYIDIPLIVEYHFYPRAYAYGGLGIGVLLGGDVQGGAGTVEDNLKSTDYFFQLGAGYALTDRLETMLRFQNSIANFSKSDASVETGFGERLLWITGTYHTVVQVMVVYHLGSER